MAGYTSWGGNEDMHMAIMGVWKSAMALRTFDRRFFMALEFDSALDLSLELNSPIVHGKGFRGGVNSIKHMNLNFMAGSLRVN